MATAPRPPKSTGQRLLTWTALIISPIILAGFIISLVSYLTFRAAKANEVTIDASGKLVGSFRHVHGGIFFSPGWPYLKQVGVLSHGTGGACLVGGVTDAATGRPATCDPISEGAVESCRAKLSGTMAGWQPYCAPEGTCWARPMTPLESAGAAADGHPISYTPIMACNRSFEPLDPSWTYDPASVPKGASPDLSFVMGFDYPSNTPMDKTASKRWRVIACINHLFPADPEWDQGGCSGGPVYGKVLTLP